MNIGKRIRLNRLFSHPNGRICSIAVDHFIAYCSQDLPSGLRRIVPTLAAIAEGKPDAVTMHRGIAASAWEPYAGRIPMILQTTLMSVDDAAQEYIAGAEDAVRLGADAVAVAAFVRGSNQDTYLRAVSEIVTEAARFEMPVICHIYPRKFDPEPRFSYDAEDIAWAVRCALECGVDVIKVPYCNSVQEYSQIIEECPVPIVAAGGPKTSTQLEALEMLEQVVKSGAAGATIGRNVWGVDNIIGAVRAAKAVIHDGVPASQAVKVMSQS